VTKNESESASRERRVRIERRDQVRAVLADPRVSAPTDLSCAHLERARFDTPHPLPPLLVEAARVATREEAGRLAAVAVAERRLDPAAFAAAIVSRVAEHPWTEPGRGATRDLLERALLLLADHPDQLAALHSDPLLIPRAVEEVLRQQPIVPALTRLAVEELRMAGLPPIRRGECFDVSIEAANRDGTSASQRFDVRGPARPHFSFGAPARTCPGAGFARVTVCEAIGALLARCRGWRREKASGPDGAVSLLVNPRAEVVAPADSGR